MNSKRAEQVCNTSKRAVRYADEKVNTGAPVSLRANDSPAARPRHGPVWRHLDKGEARGWRASGTSRGSGWSISRDQSLIIMTLPLTAGISPVS